MPLCGGKQPEDLRRVQHTTAGFLLIILLVIKCLNVFKRRDFQQCHFPQTLQKTSTVKDFKMNQNKVLRSCKNTGKITDFIPGKHLGNTAL